MKKEDIAGWIGVGVMGMLTALIGQWMNNQQIHSEVEALAEELKKEGKEEESD